MLYPPGDCGFWWTKFWRIKIVKNYLRATVGQERLTDLRISSIEFTEANSVVYKDKKKYNFYLIVNYCSKYKVIIFVSNKIITNNLKTYVIFNL